ncbi:hypothetical protein E2C01_055958 [Portunus trituberculatus]|uniref:Uncharacterized protein n=1 Tax=Portunus trituberculatus TaxID=210409 RepID=A0A5B7GP40_PORTR|nr:hypothetical protein [Portunus trituberculatus]
MERRKKIIKLAEDGDNRRGKSASVFGSFRGRRIELKSQFSCDISSKIMSHGTISQEKCPREKNTTTTVLSEHVYLLGSFHSLRCLAAYRCADERIGILAIGATRSPGCRTH